ncbi:hypothetical protein POTOM_052350 [Populus tomentosa]|uniref:Uncharacterized protein n=1 Tax=Populus tomentosa TaxID=118781 RepID=A0A8X8C8L9_POPTO|nr:hypothetical protein POTOM_052350 [Populus tomentosa]
MDDGEKRPLASEEQKINVDEKQAERREGKIVVWFLINEINADNMKDLNLQSNEPTGYLPATISSLRQVRFSSRWFSTANVHCTNQDPFLNRVHGASGNMLNGGDGYSNKEQCERSIMELALQCSNESPEERITMVEILARCHKRIDRSPPT